MEQNDKVKISMYTPKRFGYDGEIVDIDLLNVEDGPSDKNFRLNLKPKTGYVSKNNLQFSLRTKYKADEVMQNNTTNIKVKDYINVYAIARLTFDSFNEQCKHIDIDKLDDLNILLEANDTKCIGGTKNAYYQRIGKPGNGSINFCAKIMPSSSSYFDIIAHETGHAICDLLNPSLGGNSKISGAYHESFGDLAAFFASVKLLYMQGDSFKLVQFLKNGGGICLAPGFIGGECLRDSNKKSKTSCEVHSNSINFTRFFMKSINKVFEHIVGEDCSKKNRGESKMNEVALWTSNFFQRLLIKTTISSSSPKSLYHIALHAVEQAKSVCKNMKKSNLKSTIETILSQQLNEEKSHLGKCYQ